MYLEALYERLIELARLRVRTGQLTERGLARLCGVSQPHMHNVLKSARTLSNGSADRLMHVLNVNVPELLWRVPCEAEASVCAVPVVRNRIGPGTEAVFTAFRGYLPFPAAQVFGLVEPVAARLAPDLAMPRALAANDMVLLDQNPRLRSAPGGGNCWVVADGTGLRARYVKMGGTRVYLANEATASNPRDWQSVSLQSGNILNIVRARIVWIGREMEDAEARPPDEAGAGD